MCQTMISFGIEGDDAIGTHPIVPMMTTQICTVKDDRIATNLIPRDPLGIV